MPQRWSSSEGFRGLNNIIKLVPVTYVLLILSELSLVRFSCRLLDFFFSMKLMFTEIKIDFRVRQQIRLFDFCACCLLRDDLWQFNDLLTQPPFFSAHAVRYRALCLTISFRIMNQINIKLWRRSPGFLPLPSPAQPSLPTRLPFFRFMLEWSLASSSQSIQISSPIQARGGVVWYWKLFFILNLKTHNKKFP